MFCRVRVEKVDIHFSLKRKSSLMSSQYLLLMSRSGSRALRYSTYSSRSIGLPLCQSR